MSHPGGTDFSSSSTRTNAQFGAMTSARVVNPRKPAIDLSMKPFCMRASRKGETTRCYVVRNKKGKNSLHPLYSVYLEDGNRFLMSGRKRAGNKTSNYLVSLAPEPERKTLAVIGKIRGNYIGSHYAIFDEGKNPKKTVSTTSIRRELGVVAFEYDKTGPGKFMAHIPAVSESGAIAQFKPKAGQPTMQEQVESGTIDRERLLILTNKKPKWDESAKGHVLDFKGRVTKSSIKNFQLGAEEMGDETLLQFGRVDKDRFTMDFQYPLSPMQAFSIVLSTLDQKLADSKTFNGVKKIGKKLKFWGKK
eukprot:TRINITY_DN7394_c0_g1_i1.p1 TRINITY_DN7394_c0_g1~~TRINITY_DN7394_c0_g1_i1.p1  ORF type:complete len:305 (+),score=92.68 TRINITY_DN7394_c0_g1_i1:85-999(+)